MIDEKFNKLIHREIDGANRKSQSRKLRRYLESNPEAQRFYQDLVKLSNNLSDIPEVDPPQNVRKNILNAIPADKYQIKKKYPTVKLTLESFFFSHKIRYAYIFVTGLIIGGFGIGMLFTSLNQQETAVISKLSGTMINDVTDGSFRTTNQLSISETDLTGQLELSATNKALLLNIQLNTERDVRAVLDYDGNALSFIGFKDLNAPNNNLISSGRPLQFNCTGQNSYFVVWDRINSDPSPLRFKLYSAGILILDRTIQIDAE